MRLVKTLIILSVIMVLATSVLAEEQSGVTYKLLILYAVDSFQATGACMILTNETDTVGKIADNKGIFVFENLKTGKYHRNISMVGHVTIQDTVTFNNNSAFVSDTIYLVRGASYYNRTILLDSKIEVVGKREMIKGSSLGSQLKLGREEVSDTNITTKEQLLDFISKLVVESETVNKENNTPSDVITVDELLSDTSLGIGACGDFQIGYITYPYSIYGYVLSLEDSLPITEAVIINDNVRADACTIWNGTLTDSSGYFIINKLPRNCIIKLKITSQNYKVLIDSVAIDSTSVVDTFYLDATNP